MKTLSKFLSEGVVNPEPDQAYVYSPHNKQIHHVGSIDHFGGDFGITHMTWGAENHENAHKLGWTPQERESVEKHFTQDDSPQDEHLWSATDKLHNNHVLMQMNHKAGLHISHNDNPDHAREAVAKLFENEPESLNHIRLHTTSDAGGSWQEHKTAKEFVDKHQAGLTPDTAWIYNHKTKTLHQVSNSKQTAGDFGLEHIHWALEDGNHRKIGLTDEHRDHLDKAYGTGIDFSDDAVAAQQKMFHDNTALGLDNTGHLRVSASDHDHDQRSKEAVRALVAREPGIEHHLHLETFDDEEFEHKAHEGTVADWLKK
eukprot:gnl/Spiro4/4802_TR2404_c0_g1_i2.p2 gnl/Spiro4/4802_TR2404_c0_g1~~gnl/Spiro4/4802_TR2404_c0_g1_i2.p2  ORF type:complete len:314 (-),score=10.72 gnl/Spiro4/4802_TR2404_c0_g1_i2:2093-3034(-)